MLAPHLHNRPHSHVAASLLVSLGREPIRVQLAGHWITAEAVWAAPDVDQALGQAEDLLFRVRSGESTKDFTPIRDILDKYLEESASIHG